MSEMMLTKSRKEEEIASLKERLKATQDVAYFVRDALKKLETKIKDEKLIIEKHNSLFIDFKEDCFCVVRCSAGALKMVPSDMMFIKEDKNR